MAAAVTALKMRAGIKKTDVIFQKDNIRLFYIACLPGGKYDYFTLNAVK